MRMNLLSILLIAVAVIMVLVGIGASYYPRWSRHVAYTQMSVHAYGGDDLVLKQMLARGMDVNNTLGILNETALHSAVSGRHLSTVQLLLDAGADPNKKGTDPSSNSTPLFSAVSNGDIDIIKALLNHGAKVDDHSLMFAAFKHEYGVTKMLFTYGGNPDAVLSVAARHGDVKMLRLALNTKSISPPNKQAGIAVSSIDNEISLAKKLGHADVIPLLKEYRKRFAR